MSSDDIRKIMNLLETVDDTEIPIMPINDAAETRTLKEPIDGHPGYFERIMHLENRTVAEIYYGPVHIGTISKKRNTYPSSHDEFRGRYFATYFRANLKFKFKQGDATSETHDTYESALEFILRMHQKETKGFPKRDPLTPTPDIDEPFIPRPGSGIPPYKRDLPDDYWPGEDRVGDGNGPVFEELRNIFSNLTESKGLKSSIAQMTIPALEAAVFIILENTVDHLVKLYATPEKIAGYIAGVKRNIDMIVGRYRDSKMLGGLIRWIDDQLDHLEEELKSGKHAEEVKRMLKAGVSDQLRPLKDRHGIAESKKDPLKEKIHHTTYTWSVKMLNDVDLDEKVRLSKAKKIANLVAHEGMTLSAALKDVMGPAFKIPRGHKTPKMPVKEESVAISSDKIQTINEFKQFSNSSLMTKNRLTVTPKRR